MIFCYVDGTSPYVCLELLGCMSIFQYCLFFSVELFLCQVVCCSHVCLSTDLIPYLGCAYSVILLFNLVVNFHGCFFITFIRK